MANVVTLQVKVKPNARTSALTPSADGAWLALPRDGTGSLTWAGQRIGIAGHARGANGGLGRVRLLVHPPLLPVKAFADSDTLAMAVRIKAAGNAAVEVNAWIERDDGPAARSWLKPSVGAGTLCCLASAPAALVVAGYDHHATEAGWPAASLRLSSAGPLPWSWQAGNRVPHFCAPARDIWGASSKTRGFARTTGTSAAVALASGAIARLLAVRGADAALPLRAGDWSPRLGHGVFHIGDCLAGVES